MRGNRRRDTRPEVQLRSYLHALGLRFRKDYRIQAGTRRVRADIVFTRRRLAVFVDGCFWHRCPEHGTSPRANSWYWEPKLDRNAARDLEVNQALHDAAWTVLRVWEHERTEIAAARVITALAQWEAGTPHKRKTRRQAGISIP
jgi:DNA mismatch endonuclease (patch repair protein)